MMIRVIRVLIMAAMLFPGCGRRVDNMDADGRRAVISAVDSALKAFESAQRARDPEAIIALFAPDFFMYTDGKPQVYDSVARGIRQSFTTLRYVEPGFLDVNIRPLSETSALATFRFRDSLVAESGDIMRFTGATTLLWEVRDGRWLMTYGHADHSPVE